MNPELSSFAARLRGMISSGSRAVFENEFSNLALELFALQFENNSTYRKVCEARRLAPQTIGHWAQIPTVPTSVFKELELTSLAPDERTAVFHSSGTTEQKPSRHFHCAESLQLYEASLWDWFQQNCESSIARCGLICLTPPPEQAPHSSLVHMFKTVWQKLGGASGHAGRSPFFGQVKDGGTWVLNLDAVLTALQSTVNRRSSTLIFGTAFSFVHLLDELVARNLILKLPSGSRVMETGGYKNRSRSMPKAELHALIEKFLGVPREDIICEYGMSELSSQAYEIKNSKSKIQNRGNEFRFPAWARAQIISPETGREVADGETGLIRIFDLANVFSVAAIQTEDLGVRRCDGFELIGRAQLAEPRGCSLMTA